MTIFHDEISFASRESQPVPGKKFNTPLAKGIDRRIVETCNESDCLILSTRICKVVVGAASETIRETERVKGRNNCAREAQGEHDRTKAPIKKFVLTFHAGNSSQRFVIFAR